MSRYNGYNNDWGKRATAKYIKEKQRRVTISWKKEVFEERIEPVIKASGLSMAEFIKEAIDEKIEKIQKDQAPVSDRN